MMESETSIEMVGDSGNERELEVNLSPIIIYKTPKVTTLIFCLLSLLLGYTTSDLYCDNGEDIKKLYNKIKPHHKTRFFTKDKLFNMREEVTKKQNELIEYYGEHLGMLTDGLQHNNVDFHDYLTDTFGIAIVNDDQDEFIIGAIGSSVMAGHDNCEYDNLSNQLKRGFESVFKTIGMKLVVRNAGEGGRCGDSHRNQVYCTKQNMGDDIDIALYSWTYFESVDAGVKEHESMVRWTQMMKKRPPVNIIHTGRHQYNPCYTDEKNKKVFEQYSKYGLNAVCIESGLESGGLYPGKQWGVVGDGYHNTTRYGENEENEERKNSLGVVYRNWHIGPLGFQYAADVLMFGYLKSIINALDKIDNEFKNSRDPRNLFKPREILMKEELPDPLFCDVLYCKVDHSPECLNLELPTFGWNGASLVKKGDVLNPKNDQTQSWSPWKDRGSNHLVPKLEQKLYMHANSPIKCDFPDFCAGIKSTGPADGYQVIKLPKMEVGMVTICCNGNLCAKDEFYNNDGFVLDIDGKHIPKEKWKLNFPENKCVRIQERFEGVDDDELGHQYLTLYNGNHNRHVTLTQVITI